MVFESCVLPVLSYGCQTWSITKEQEKKIEIWQRSVERSLLNITRKDKINNRKLRETTLVKDAAIHIRKLKWQWAGHVARSDNSRWIKVVTEWIPLNKRRKKGRPLMRWQDEIKKEEG